MKLASECCLPLLFMLPSLFVCVPLVLHLTVMSYFQLTALPTLYSSLLYRFIHRKKKSEAESHFSGLLRWVKNISTRGNNLNGFRGSQAVWGSELAMQSSSGTAGMTQSSALDQHCPDQDHPSEQPKPYMFCREERRSPLDSQPLSWQHSQLSITLRNLL